MATSAKAFSPKEFTYWIISDDTNAGSTGIHAANMNQLDVDSVGFPSLNVTQALDVKSGGAGRTFKDEDFFQDKTLRVVEISLAGTMHKDDGHRLLLRNICDDASGDCVISSGHIGAEQLYGSAVANAASSLTLVMKASDHSNQQSMVFAGCVVTNFVLSADMSDGGRYKFSATLQTGREPNLAETSTVAGNSVYSNTECSYLTSASGFKVMNQDVVMNSFSCTIDHPAVFSGVTTTGYHAINRGADCAVTVDTQIKYDDQVKTIVNAYDTQTAHNGTNSFVCTNNGNFGVTIDNAVYTNVAFSEGDIMMVDVSLKSVDDGTDALVTFDITA